jgi:predicted dehydrogenase
LRVAHNEPISQSHQALKAQAKQMGSLLSSFFTRLTPGRGKRPEILFNLKASGPPALFFVYHVYPLVDIFGPAAWVESGARYTNLNDARQYDQFANTLTVGFQSGGLAQWNWAGGIEIQEAEEFNRIVLTEGTLIRENGPWRISTPGGIQEVSPVSYLDETLYTQFLKDVTQDTAWKEDAQTAIDAARIGLAAERSVAENQRIQISDCT